MELSDTEMTSDVFVPAFHSVGRPLAGEDLKRDNLNPFPEHEFDMNEPNGQVQVHDASVEDVDMVQSFSDVDMEDAAAVPSIMVTAPKPTPRASKKRSYDAQDGDLRESELRGDEADEHQRSRMERNSHDDVLSEDLQNGMQPYHGEHDEFYEPGHPDSLRLSARPQSEGSCPKRAL
jgi:ribosomal protein L12E/L44/L45/RPP1/RPP2